MGTCGPRKFKEERAEVWGGSGKGTGVSDVFPTIRGPWTRLEAERGKAEGEKFLLFQRNGGKAGRRRAGWELTEGVRIPELQGPLFLPLQRLFRWTPGKADEKEECRALAARGRGAPGGETPRLGPRGTSRSHCWIEAPVSPNCWTRDEEKANPYLQDTPSEFPTADANPEPSVRGPDARSGQRGRRLGPLCTHPQEIYPFRFLLLQTGKAASKSAGFLGPGLPMGPGALEAEPRFRAAMWCLRVNRCQVGLRRMLKEIHR